MNSLKISRTSKYFFFIGITFLLVSISLGIYVAVVVDRISKYGIISNQLNQLRVTINQSTVSVKEFLLNAYTDEGFVKTGSNESFEAFNYSLVLSMSQLGVLGKSWFVNTQEKKQKVVLLTRALENYKSYLNELAMLFKMKGFKDLGLEGEMREAVHFIENYENGTNKELLLTLRRHEKDFLLRKDAKYIDKFDTDHAKFIDWATGNKPYSQAELLAIISAMEKYKTLFHQIVDIEKRIGLTSKEGLRAQINAQYLGSGNELDVLSNEAKKEQEQLTNYAWYVNIALIALFGMLITASIWCVVYFTKQVVKPIEELNAAADEIARGHLSVSLDHLRSKKLVSDIIDSFEKLIGKLRVTIAQIEDISARKMTAIIELNSDKDEIGLSLNKIIAQISTFDEDERKRKWAIEGYAKFSEIVRNSTGVNELAYTITSELVNYLGANQAGFFIVREGKESQDGRHLALIGGYAYNRKKHSQKIVAIGEGLVGQCLLEKDTIFMTDIPENYLSITSGLGDASPRCLVIVPFKVNQMIAAVFEIASFRVLESHEIIFLEKVGEVVASSISSLSLNEKTNLLLATSIQQAEENKSQEEEMRQNMEELAATQEEYERNSVISNEKIEQLESEILVLRNEKTSLSATIGELEKKYNFRPALGKDSTIVDRTSHPRRIEFFLDN